MKLNPIHGRFVPSLVVLAVFSIATSLYSAPQSGPVVGATVIVKLAPSGSLVANCVTNEMGECTFSYLPAKKSAGDGIFDLYITAPSNSQTTSKPKKVSVTFTNKQGPTFTYIVMWDTSKSNQGGFAVSGRNNA
jgi:hypothetical protein